MFNEGGTQENECCSLIRSRLLSFSSLLEETKSEFYLRDEQYVGHLSSQSSTQRPLGLSFEETYALNRQYRGIEQQQQQLQTQTRFTPSNLNRVSSRSLDLVSAPNSNPLPVLPSLEIHGHAYSNRPQTPSSSSIHHYSRSHSIDQLRQIPTALPPPPKLTYPQRPSSNDPVAQHYHPRYRTYLQVGYVNKYENNRSSHLITSMNVKGAIHQVKEEKKATYFLFCVTLALPFLPLLLKLWLLLCGSWRFDGCVRRLGKEKEKRKKRNKKREEKIYTHVILSFWQPPTLATGPAPTVASNFMYNMPSSSSSSSNDYYDSRNSCKLRRQHPVKREPSRRILVRPVVQRRREPSISSSCESLDEPRSPVRPIPTEQVCSPIRNVSLIHPFASSQIFPVHLCHLPRRLRW